MKKTHIFGLIVSMALLLGACTPAPSQPDSDELALIVSRTQTAIAVRDVATEAETPTPTVLLPSATPPPVEAEPTDTPTTEPSATASPSPTFPPQPADCTNKVKFEDETIQDNTSFSVNKPFTKSWTLRNTGTCTWTPDYALAFVSGERMGAPDTVPIGQAVEPNETLVARIDLTAPGASGTYQGDFKLQTPSGVRFGLGANGDKAFWVKIRVIETTGELNLGTPTWTDTFDSDSGFWPLGEDSLIGYKLSNGKLVMTALKAVGDQWRLNAKPPAKNLFMEATFETSDACSGKDSFGLIARSSESDKDVYNNGYVFVVSCDGMYRLYRMDEGTFVSLVNWTASADINAGKNQTNRLSLLLEDGLIRLYANGNRLAQVSDSGHASGKWGLVVRTMDTPNFAVSVADFSFWALGD